MSRVLGSALAWFQKRAVDMNVSLDINERHASALLKLLDLLDYKAVKSCANSEQDAYDMILALDSLRTALKAKGITWDGDPTEHRAQP